MTKTKQSYAFSPAQGVPPGVAPFSHATRWGDLLFVTGQMPTDPATGQIVPGDVVAQAEQVRRNLEAVLAQFAATLDDALMVRVYLTDFGDYAAFKRHLCRLVQGAVAGAHLRRRDRPRRGCAGRDRPRRRSCGDALTHVMPSNVSVDLSHATGTAALPS